MKKLISYLKKIFNFFRKKKIKIQTSQTIEKPKLKTQKNIPKIQKNKYQPRSMHPVEKYFYSKKRNLQYWYNKLNLDLTKTEIFNHLIK